MLRNTSSAHAAAAGAAHLAEVALSEAHVLPVLVFADDELGRVDLAGVLCQDQALDKSIIRAGADGAVTVIRRVHERYHAPAC
jgi:hypothetical protein